MSEQPQITVVPIATKDRPLGDRRDENLKSIFNASPIYNEELNELERQESFARLALNGNVNDSVVVAGVTVAGGQGHGIDSYNRDFIDAPNIDDVDINEHNLPSPYVPNPVSPGPGSFDDASKNAYTGEVLSADDASAKQFGVGLGGTANPSQTSELIANQFNPDDSGALGIYIKGSSFDTSNGNG